MILGVGTDIVRIDRVAKLYSKYGEKFTSKFMSDREIAILPHGRAAEFLAGRFAAKEALIKAMGGREFSVRSISILPGATGGPVVDDISPLADALGRQLAAAHVSISHDGEYAVAFVVIEGAD